jgi:hypothetical protein
VKALTTTQLVEICDASPAQVETAAQLLGKTFAQDVQWLGAGVKDGTYKSSVVRIGSVDRFLLVYHINDQNVFFVNGAAQLTPKGGDFDALLEAVVTLAKKHACRAVETITIRAGLLKKMLAAGYSPIGVSLTLPL